MTTLTFKTYSYDPSSNTASFLYETGGYAFEEKIVFKDAPAPLDASAFNKALSALHIALGINYYKSFLPETIEGLSLTAEQARFWEDFYYKGLGEFRYVNQVKLKGKIKFPVDATARAEPSDVALPKRALVPVGGGKDSIVTIEALKPFAPLLFSLGTTPAIEECIRIAELPSVSAVRIQDPQLHQLIKEGKALSGHVPITAMMMFILGAGSVLWGYDAIVFSNERSANCGNAFWEGEEVNHQWSKSFEAETMCQTYFQKFVLKNLACFSLLREMSELSISRTFAKLSAYHHAFNSCNRQFALDPAKRETRWCLKCPKCAFTFLIIAPFIKKDRMIQIFGKNLLDDAGLQKTYEELLGLQGIKPFICVGEFEEAAQAFHMLKQDPAWGDDFILKTLWPPVPADDALIDRGAHAVPPSYRKALHALIRS